MGLGADLAPIDQGRQRPRNTPLSKYLQNNPLIWNLTALAKAGLVLQATAANDIPAKLPRPDGKPGDATKPVKVYVLAGQSNMVGMGDITAARPLYPSIFLSADPRVVPVSMPIGGFGLAAHGIYQSADAQARQGAVVALHKGAYDPKADYAKLTPTQATQFYNVMVHSFWPGSFKGIIFRCSRKMFEADQGAS